MPVLKLGPTDGLYYEYDAPADGRHTLVFVNALTGNTGAWQDVIGPALRASGLGTLCYNFRGQADSSFDPGMTFSDGQIVGDLVTLLSDIAPPRPVLCGLSIGGLFAARAVLAGVDAEGLVLLNTLRRMGPRLNWINDAMLRIVRQGGTRMLADMYFPLLTNQDFQAAARPGFLAEDPYEPMDAGHGHVKLMAAGGTTDWDLPYEKLTLPTLVISGLQDRVFFDAGDVSELFARLPDGRRVDWDDAGHLLPAERPEKLSALLTDFAGGLNP